MGRANILLQLFKEKSFCHRFHWTNPKTGKKKNRYSLLFCSARKKSKNENKNRKMSFDQICEKPSNLTDMIDEAEMYDCAFAVK